MEFVVKVLVLTASFAIIVLTGWVHKHCSGLSGSLDNVVNFKCRTCLNLPVTNDEDKKFELDNVDYEVADQFCYRGNMLYASGGAEASAISHVRSG